MRPPATVRVWIWRLLMLRELLEECEQSRFAEVVLMLANSATTAEVYTMFEDLRFS